MIVCVCRRISDHQIRQAARDGYWNVDALPGLGGFDREEAGLQVHVGPLQQAAVATAHRRTHPRYNDRADEVIAGADVDDDLQLRDRERFSVDRLGGLGDQSVERVAGLGKLGVGVLERRAEELERVVPRLRRHLPRCLRIHEGPGCGGFDLDELGGALLVLSDELGEPLQPEPDLEGVAFGRGLLPRNLRPPVGEVGQLGELDLPTRLGLGQFLERPLTRSVLGHLRRQPVVGLLGAAARLLELVVPLHRPLRRAFPGDGDLEVDDGLPPVDEENPVPPVAGLAEFEAHKWLCFR